ncbi:hypothetical protein WJX73_010536 [Symbiochloris irregularis]|uniref:Uncharacterized protein n=1 Tax=Symbiochloris irregularis TaxID=706552 RepID=A0AAW1NTX1_9CHLO
MEHVQELQGLTRQLQRDLRVMERPSTDDPTDLAHYFAGLREVLPAHARCLALSEATAALPQSGVPSQLLEQADLALEAADRMQEKLVTSLGHVIRQQLGLLGWPPPLVASAPGPALGPPTSQEPQWQGLEAANEQVVSNVQQAMSTLVVVQRAVQCTSFLLETDAAEGGGSPPADAPPLWAVEQLAQPLAERLRLHFGPGRPMDQPDRPELLLSLVARLTHDVAPSLAPLQGAIAAPLADLPQHWYFVPVEFARAMRGVVQTMLKEQLLPQLVIAGNAHAWLHLAECLHAFEKEMAPLRGIPRHTAEPLDDALELWASGSCLETLCTQEAWRQGWWMAERGEALRQLEIIVDAPDAWQPAADVWDAPDDGLMASHMPEEKEAWREEFWPPICADTVLLLVVDLARRAAWMGSEHLRSSYAAAVPKAILAEFRGRLERLLKTAQDFRALASESWAPRVAGYACAAHHMQHSLREATGALLLLDLPGERSDGAPTASVLTQEADAFGSFQDRTARKLARAVATRFSDASSAYTRRKGLDAFGATFNDGREVHTSPSLDPGIRGLEADLVRLSTVLDAVLFRQLWRFVAVGIQHSLFNEVATEAHFSQQGSQQFATDVAAVIGVFQPWTPRPAAHFRELSDAVILLTMPQDQAHSFAASLGAAAEAHQGDAQGIAHDGIDELLSSTGITRLTVPRAMAVLAKRLW